MKLNFQFSNIRQLYDWSIMSSSGKLYIIDKVLAWDIELGLFFHFTEFLIKPVYMKDLTDKTWS